MISQSCRSRPPLATRDRGSVFGIASNCVVHGRLRGFCRKAAASPSSPLDEPSGIWQMPKLSWLDPVSMDTGDSFLPEEDSPALDYVMRYSAPTEDDPNDPAFDAAAAGLQGPDMHAPLEPADDSDTDVAAGSGARVWRGVPSLLRQLRQRALSGSSSDDDEAQRREPDWQSMDIPALLLSPHHAAALQSLSSSEEDTSQVPDFADLTRAREADLAAQAAAELAPPELRPLVRAASLLDYLRAQQGRRGVSGSGRSPIIDAADAVEDTAGVPAEANRFAGLCEPLTEEQLEAVAIIVGSGDCNSHVGVPPPISNEVELGSKKAADGQGRGDASWTRLAAAAAAALAEEGVEWLRGAQPAATAAAVPAAAMGSEGGRGDATVTVDAEDRSVQLRRMPCMAAAAGGVDDKSLERVTKEAARELAEAEAHVVRHGSGSGGAATRATHGAVGGFVALKRASTADAGAVADEAAGTAAAVEKVAAAGGRAAADEAAASVAAEARRAVWGEGGWPCDAAMRSEDIVTELKSAIWQQQQQDAEHGSPNTLLP